MRSNMIGKTKNNGIIVYDYQGFVGEEKHPTNVILIVEDYRSKTWMDPLFRYTLYSTVNGIDKSPVKITIRDEFSEESEVWLDILERYSKDMI